MKIQCDVCGVESASVLCSADEAALCRGCDDRVHSANKLAGKHRRVSLLHPTSKPLPLCDICKESRGFVFCQNDRAILCLLCDVPIHSANTNTRKHIRFLLSGVRLSTASSSDTEIPPPQGWRVDDSAATGNLTSCHLVSEEAVETEMAGSCGGAWAWPGGAVEKMEDLPVWVTPFPATDMTQDRWYPLMDSMERGWNEWKEEASMVPQIQF